MAAEVMIPMARSKEMTQWGYNKNVIPFPYLFVKNKAYSLSERPQWCLSLTRGKSPVCAQESKEYLLNQKCNRWDEIDLSFVKTADPLWLERIDRSLFTQLNDILINSTGEESIGRASLFPLPDLARQDEIAAHISAGKDRIKELRQRAEGLRRLAKGEFKRNVFGE